MNTETQSTVQQQPAAGAGSQAPAVRRLERMVVDSAVPIFDTGMFEHMMRIAKLMANSSLVPEHLNRVKKVNGRDYAIEPDEAIANCFLVTNQAMHWKMDPFAVAQHTHVTKGKIGYEGKLIAAAINSNPSIVERLSYQYEGAGPNRKVIATARHAADRGPKSIEGTVGQWQTKEKDGSVKENWAKNPDQQLSYRGAREWARRHFPEIILGVWGDDELDFESGNAQPSADLPTTPQRGSAGLRTALGASAETATDATIISEDSQTEAPVAEQPGAATDAVTGTDAAIEVAEKKKPAGTLEQRDGIVAKLKRCNDLDILALASDEGRDYEWSPADQVVLTEAYKARAKELGEKT